ncbi:IclR family transcriptional regulator [Paracoccus beibuensis]|uniref:IclR family transcriptional regulator n=1 Tax=Paracoccus beibuensis TaxID=547602 RepID=UPI00223EC7EE|nr:IclR family transcriptional regulator [Paracoccus beibuensis]
MSPSATVDKPATNLRNLLILEALAAGSRPMTVAELNSSVKLPKPTVHRLIGTLEEEGFLIRHLDGRTYLPGPKLRQMMLGVMRAGQHSLAQRQILTRLNEKIRETCNLSIPDTDAMIYIDRVETEWPLRIQLHAGSRVPLHATSAGKLCLAHMTQETLDKYLRSAQLRPYTERTVTDPDRLLEQLTGIKEQGFSTDEEEFVQGMIAVAVPAFAPDGQLAATLSFHAPHQRLTLEKGLAHLEDLRSAAKEISQLFV